MEESPSVSLSYFPSRLELSHTNLAFCFLLAGANFLFGGFKRWEPHGGSMVWWSAYSL